VGQDGRGGRAASFKFLVLSVKLWELTTEGAQRPTASGRAADRRKNPKTEYVAVEPLWVAPGDGGEATSSVDNGRTPYFGQYICGYNLRNPIIARFTDMIPIQEHRL